MSRSTYEVVGPVGRFDERDTVFAREALVPGSKEETHYHELNPSLKEIDDQLSKFINDKLDRKSLFRKILTGLRLTGGLPVQAIGATAMLALTLTMFFKIVPNNGEVNTITAPPSLSQSARSRPEADRSEALPPVVVKSRLAEVHSSPQPSSNLKPTPSARLMAKRVDRQPLPFEAIPENFHGQAASVPSVNYVSTDSRHPSMSSFLSSGESEENYRCHYTQ